MADTLQYVGDSNKVISSSYLFETLQDLKTERQALYNYRIAQKQTAHYIQAMKAFA